MPHAVASKDTHPDSAPETHPSPDTLDTLLHSFRMFQLADSRAIRHEVAALGLNETDVRLVFFLSAGEDRGVTPKRVGEELELSTGAVTNLLDRLERRGYVSRQPNPGDRRSVIVQLSDTGHEVAKTICHTYREVFLNSIDADQHAALAQGFEQITLALSNVAKSGRS